MHRMAKYWISSEQGTKILLNLPANEWFKMQNEWNFWNL